MLLKYLNRSTIFMVSWRNNLSGVFIRPTKSVAIQSLMFATNR